MHILTSHRNCSSITCIWGQTDRQSVNLESQEEEGLLSEFSGKQHPQRVTGQPGGLCHVKRLKVLLSSFQGRKMMPRPVSQVADLPSPGQQNQLWLPAHNVESSRTLSPPSGWKSSEDGNPVFSLLACLLTPSGIPR